MSVARYVHAICCWPILAPKPRVCPQSQEKTERKLQQQSPRVFARLQRQDKDISNMSARHSCKLTFRKSRGMDSSSTLQLVRSSYPFSNWDPAREEVSPLDEDALPGLPRLADSIIGGSGVFSRIMPGLVEGTPSVWFPEERSCCRSAPDAGNVARRSLWVSVRNVEES